jgi:uncharacterized membrane protein AbrB (regulator of aidB expression)
MCLGPFVLCTMWSLVWQRYVSGVILRLTCNAHCGSAMLSHAPAESTKTLTMSRSNDIAPSFVTAMDGPRTTVVLKS